MEIELNGEPKTIEKSTSLNHIISEFVNNTKGLAVALNNSVIPKEKWKETMLKESDKVLLIKATQGG